MIMADRPDPENSVAKLLLAEAWELVAGTVTGEGVVTVAGKIAGPLFRSGSSGSLDEAGVWMSSAGEVADLGAG